MIRNAFTAVVAGATLVSSANAAIVINEIDYDNVGTDGTEFIEFFNPDSTSQDLTGLSLVLFNGESTTATPASYDTFALSGSIPAGGYFVFGNVAGANLDPTKNADLIQNGSRDGFGIYSGTAPTTATATNLVVGAVYEGQGTFPSAFELITVADSNTVAGSLQRNPNGTGSFALLDPTTPGATNAVPEPASFALMGLGALALIRRRRA